MARISQQDAAHDRAIELSKQISGRIVTTAWVLTEVADALHTSNQRQLALALYDALRSDPHAIIVQPSVDVYERGWQLYRGRPDKNWSLTDCISFVVMSEMNLREALTGDKHFEQAGFVALLK